MSIHWTNKAVPFCHGESIVEWDMKAANLSLMRYYDLAPQRILDKIDGMEKSNREIYVGKMSRRDRNFAVALEKAFTDMVEKFISENELNQDNDIIAIKKDAVFVRNREIRHSEFGPVLFRPKGIYSGFLKIPRFEFYLGSDGEITVKGLSDDLLSLHQEGVIQFIKDVFEESRNWNELNRYMKEYAKLYKERQLPFDAYREFNENSRFNVIFGGNKLQMDVVDDSALERCDISYNYLNVYLEVLKIVIGK